MAHSIGLVLVLCAGLTLPGLAAAQAGTVTVFAAGAAKQVERAVAKLVPPGMAVAGVYDTVGALRDRVLQGEKPDVVMLSRAGVEALDAKGLLAPGSRVPLGSVAVALAVKRGAPLPDIGTADALRETLLAAPSIAYADPARGATAGTHFARVLAALGIKDKIADRTTVLPFGIDVIDAVAAGKFALGVSQSSEIALHPTVSLVGPLPQPYALETHYEAARLAGSGEAGERFLEALRSPAGREAIVRVGFAR